MREFYTKVVGTTFDGRDEIIEELYFDGDMDCGQRLVLQRQKNNVHDRNAIAVMHPKSMQQLGFIGRDIAAKLAPVIDLGTECYAEVQAVTGGGMGRYGINIKVICLDETPKSFTPRYNVSSTFKIKVILSGSQDVFHLEIEASKNGKEIEKKLCKLNHYITVTDITVNQPIDKIVFSFEEHQIWKNYIFPLEERYFGCDFGFIFSEKPNPDDIPTYAGSYTYMHPIFDYEIVPVQDID